MCLLWMCISQWSFYYDALVYWNEKNYNNDININKLEEPSLVQKILRSLLDRFNPKVSTIEEINDLKSLEFDQLIGALTAYEMGIVKYKPISRKASFKLDKNEDSEPDEIEEKLRRLKKGSGKYKGKLPFKCFNCGRIVHFVSFKPAK